MTSMSSTVIIESFVVYWHTNKTSHNHENKYIHDLKANHQYFSVRFIFIIIQNYTIIYNIIYYFELNYF